MEKDYYTGEAHEESHRLFLYYDEGKEGVQYFKKWARLLQNGHKYWKYPPLKVKYYGVFEPSMVNICKFVPK